MSSSEDEVILTPDCHSPDMRLSTGAVMLLTGTTLAVGFLAGHFVGSEASSRRVGRNAAAMMLQQGSEQAQEFAKRYDQETARANGLPPHCKELYLNARAADELHSAPPTPTPIPPIRRDAIDM
jgi:hypothetical protein